MARARIREINPEKELLNIIKVIKQRLQGKYRRLHNAEFDTVSDAKDLLDATISTCDKLRTSIKSKASSNLEQLSLLLLRQLIL